MVAGSLLSDRYRIDGRLATGGMGSVYVATDERLGREVAIKLLKEELADDPRFVERFRREARAAGALTHPNVANVYDFAQHEGHYYIVMELVRGHDLSRVLREGGPLGAARSALITAQIASALHHAHSAGVVHRDIKPPNVIVGDDDRVKVTDFGIARAIGDSTLTATGSVLGTAHYISPEQASGAEVGPATDIYSLGIVLYEMLTGSLPFTGDSAIAVAMRHVSDDVPPPSELNPEVPRALDEVVATATAKDPDRRFADAATMAAAVDAAASGDGHTPSTAVMAGGGGTEVLHTVWPIPGNRYDPQKLGRRVLITLGALAAIALLLLLLRLGDEAPNEAGRATPQEDQAEEPQVEPAAFVVPDGIIGSTYGDAEATLKDAGLSVTREYVEDDDPADIVVRSDPPPGSELQEGDAITLFVSAGPEEDDEEDQDEEEDEKGPPEHSKGKGKDKEKDD